MTVSEAKQTQRKAGRAARKALGPEERKAANAALCAFLWQLAAVQNAQTILLYAAFGSEADLSAFAEKAQAQGKTLAYPVCGEAYSLTAALPGPDGWEVGQYGIRSPILSRSEILLPEALDLVLVPCTALMQTASGSAWAKVITTAFFPAAPMRERSALHLKRSGSPMPPWTGTTSGWTPM